jgi:hypothetical protein
MDAMPHLGYSLVSNGSSNKDHNTKVLHCSCHHKASLSQDHTSRDYRSTYICSNKRAGSRGEASRKMPCCTDSYKASSGKQCCQVRVYLGVGCTGFSLMEKNVWRKHTYHPWHCDESLVPTVELNKIPREGRHLMDKLRTAGLSHNATPAAYRRQHGTRITPVQVMYIYMT